jgi:hypothetical protein
VADTARWLFDRGISIPPSCRRRLCGLLASTDDVIVVQRVLALHRRQDRAAVLESAIANGCVRVADFLRDELSALSDSMCGKAIKMAANGGHVAMLDWCWSAGIVLPVDLRTAVRHWASLGVRVWLDQHIDPPSAANEGDDGEDGTTFAAIFDIKRPSVVGAG